MTATQTAATGSKSWIATLLICFFLGSLGIHRFYVGKVGTGILMLITFGGLGVWTLIDFITIAVGKFSDKQGQALAR
jgi:TM2 domain-containing membrane protein YozV